MTNPNEFDAPENLDEFNAQIIEEFRANEGAVGGPLEGAPILLLHSTGAKSGEERLHPVLYQAVGEDLAIFAAYAGGPKNPAWYHNLVANADATVEIGTDTIQVKARVASGDERETIWMAVKADFPQFVEYKAKTDREIPVVILQPRS